MSYFLNIVSPNLCAQMLLPYFFLNCPNLSVPGVRASPVTPPLYWNKTFDPRFPFSLAAMLILWGALFRLRCSIQRQENTLLDLQQQLQR